MTLILFQYLVKLGTKEEVIGHQVPISGIEPPSQFTLPRTAMLSLPYVAIAGRPPPRYYLKGR